MKKDNLLGLMINNDKNVLFAAQGCKVSGQHNRKESMSEQKNAKKTRNYLVTNQCPKCAKNSEHSFSRVQKGAMLMCPHCSQLFQPVKNNAA